MKAIGFYKPGDASVLQWIDLPEPTPGNRDLIVRVEAVSVNPADVQSRASTQPKEDVPLILGYDAAGTVVKVGSEVSLFKVGDEVFYSGSMDRPGTDAQFQAVDERIVGRKPASLSWTDAAAMPLTSLAAWELLFDRMRLPYGNMQAGGTLLIINGSGGVGSILIQLARRLTGLIVVATASRPETVDWCQKMGAHHVIDHHKPLDAEMQRIGIVHAEFVAGLTATDKHLPEIVTLISPEGTFALIDNPKTLDITPFKMKACTVAWELMFTRPMFKTRDMARQGFILNQVSALLDAGVLRTTATTTLGALTPETLAEAHRLSERGTSIGKTVLPGIAG